MKYVRINQTMSIKPIGGGFLMPILDTGTLLLVESEEVDGTIIASLGSDRFRFKKHSDNVTVVVYEVPTLVYDLWYKGIKTEHTFDLR